MKRTLSLIISVIAIVSLFVSCSSNIVNRMVSLNENNDGGSTKPGITVQSPMTLSNNNMFPINGQHQYLRLKMIKGEYNEDWNPGGNVGARWQGDFIIELDDEYGNLIARTDISKEYNEQLSFSAMFDIQFDDYNGDGDLDFTIGQYASSNGRNYKLFTLRDDGKVESLPVKDYTELFISNASGYYSAKLTKLDDITFKVQYYDNSRGKDYENIFKWDGKQFVLNENHEVAGS